MSGAMAGQSQQWTEFLSCPVCLNIFDEANHKPISLACGHTVCRFCLTQLSPKKCPFDNTVIVRKIEELPVNFALLQLVGATATERRSSGAGVLPEIVPENIEAYNAAKKCIDDLTIYLKPVDRESGASSQALSRPMQRKLMLLVNCPLVEEDGRSRAMRAARSLGERTVTELILQHQNSQQLSANLWAAVRARGCQFLGPAMQEEVLKLILLALEDGSALSRKVLVLFVVQRLEAQYPQASKTAIGHVVQLLYRASCFKVTKREEESSLMQLKDEFRTYDLLRREHDSQIVQIATEAGLRISPEQWSSLLYGDTAHKSHMQSIIDKLQTPQSFHQGVFELNLALQRTGDPSNIVSLLPHFELLASIDPEPDATEPMWEELERFLLSIRTVVQGLVAFTQQRVIKKQDVMPLHNPKYKTSMCRDIIQRGRCPRGANCTFAHTTQEMDRYRQRNKRSGQMQGQENLTGGLELSPGASMGGIPMNMTSPHRTSDDVMILDGVPVEAEAGAYLGRSARGLPSPSMRKDGTKPCGTKVAVPIAVPNTMPVGMKTRQQSRSIYTSISMHGQDKQSLYPTIIPVAQKAPQLQESPPSPRMMYADPRAFAPTDVGGAYIIQSNSVPQSQQIRQRWMVPGQVEGGNTVLMFPRHPYSFERCPGLTIKDTATYSASAITARGKSPSEQLEDLQKRRSELVAQLNKSSQNGDEHNTSSTASHTQVSPSSATAISHRVYDRYSISPETSTNMAHVTQPDVHKTKTRMTFSDQHDQLYQPCQTQGHKDPETQQDTSTANQTPCNVSATEGQQNSNSKTHSEEPKQEEKVESDKNQPANNVNTSRSNPSNLIGLSVTVSAANAIVTVATETNRNTAPKNAHLSHTGSVQSNSSIYSSSTQMSQTNTINTVVTITLSQTFQPGPLCVSAGFHSEQPVQNEEQESKMAPGMKIPMSRPLADSMATSFTAMTLANQASSYHGVPAKTSESMSKSEGSVQTRMSSAVSLSSSISSSMSRGVSSTHRPAMYMTYVQPHCSDELEFIPRSALDDNDEFIPFSEDYTVSKYGPISRMVKAKLKETLPVQVTAGQRRGTHPVTAVTPVTRPFPIYELVPSRYAPPSGYEEHQRTLLVNPGHMGHSDHQADPCGMHVASSLPTALMQPNVLASVRHIGNASPLPNLGHRMLSMSEEHALEESNTEQARIRYELVALNSQIQHLQESEDERLVRELQALEMDIEHAKSLQARGSQKDTNRDDEGDT